MVLALALALAARAALQGGAQDWPATWTRVQELARLAPESAELAAGLESLGDQAEEAAGTPRGALLEAWIARLGGGAAPLSPPASAAADWPYAGEENWLAAEVLAPSPLRALAARKGLEELGGPVSSERIRLAWEIGVEEARALRLEGALDLQTALHQRSAAAWSASDLALTLSRLGRFAEADKVLQEQIAREEAQGASAADLWAGRGTFALGAGDEARGRDYLGVGLMRGSTDAGVVLARLDLEQGRLPEARAGFRALMLADEVHPWALRGFGIAHLPEPPAAPWRAEPKR